MREAAFIKQNHDKWDEFEKLCQIQCTIQEISYFFGMTNETIQTRVKEHYNETFSVIFNQKKEVGRISLRRMQMQVALKGNPTMLIWLGKQHLEQKDQANVSGVLKVFQTCYDPDLKPGDTAEK